MKKMLLIITLLVAVLILCSCGQMNIKCSINKDNSAEMILVLDLPIEDLSSNEIASLDYTFNVDQLVNNWEKEGYTVNYEGNDEKFYIELIKTAQGTSPEDALNKLLDMMGDDSSPFSSVQGGYSESNLNDLYNINAVVDLTNIVDHDYISTLDQEQQDRISELMSTFSGTVTLDLHGKTVEYKGVLDGTANTVELSLNEPTEIYSMVEVEHKENMAEYEGLKAEVANIISEKSKYMAIVFICAGVLIASAIAIIIIMILRKGKKSKQAEVKADSDSNETEIIKNNEDQDDSSGKE